LIIKAPAKINLALHVTGQRADGYHEIESLVTFASVGDVISISASKEDRLTFSGPFGAALAADFGSNLVIKALNALRADVGGKPCPPVAIHLEKNLPLASGIGGGSADAAATLNGLNQFWGLGLSHPDLASIGAALGADVPMCVFSVPLIAKGIGADITPVVLPDFSMLLVNPRVAVSTQSIFKSLASKDNAPLQAGVEAAAQHLDAFVSWLAATRNDLETQAKLVCPVIDVALALLRENGALIARMSGSGATCFGIFANQEMSAKARANIAQKHSDWWMS
jgi:4-diphosphocytidyl-2-C-methyl-D-erythritol kinase